MLWDSEQFQQMVCFTKKSQTIRSYEPWRKAILNGTHGANQRTEPEVRNDWKTRVLTETIGSLKKDVFFPSWWLQSSWKILVKMGIIPR